MATKYVAEATVRGRLGGRAPALLDRSGGGAEDPGLLTDIIDEMGAIIDARLDQRLQTPFAAITATPATPDIISRIALHLALSDVYAYWEPDGRDATTHFDKADTWLNEILAGNLDVPGATRQTAAKARGGTAYEASTPTYAGVDEYGIDRTNGI